MSSKRQLKQFTLLSAVSATAGFTSPITSIGMLDNVGIQVDLTGNVAGTLSVQVSANHLQDNMSPANVSNAGTWATLTSQAIIAGAPATTYFDLNQLSAPYIRVVFVATSGTGTASVVITGKML